ncbi:unnamed protein product [Prunus armeniaca]
MMSAYPGKSPSKICLWACPGLWPSSTAWSCLCAPEPKVGPRPLAARANQQRWRCSYRLGQWHLLFT